MRTVTIRFERSRVSVVPERGSLVSGLKVADHNVLYLDRATLTAPGSSVRGGVPVLFPFAGRLEGDRLLPHNTVIPRHGFARLLPWSLVRADGRSATTRLTHNVGTSLQYPYRFALEQTVTALADGVHIALAVENLGENPLPLAPGWHPYFACPERLKAHVLNQIVGHGTNAGAAFDFSIPAPASSRIEVDIGSQQRVTLTFSGQLRTIQLWTEVGKDFICIEPILGPANTINTDGRATVNPGEHSLYWMRIELDSTNFAQEVFYDGHRPSDQR
jgi:galactose mutarotase-like enzyme